MTSITTLPSIPIQESISENSTLTDQLTPSARITPMPSPHQNLAAQARYSLVPPKRTRGSKPAYKVPFFSFTRTPEGSSLTTSAGLLAALFPPSERYMVICGGELDGADERMARQERGIEDPDDDDASNLDSTLKCLQIDLRKYGLGGWRTFLVPRDINFFRQTRIGQPIFSSARRKRNQPYVQCNLQNSESTGGSPCPACLWFGLLLQVDKKHARRARGLIQGC